VEITIPCDATSATLFVNYDLVNGHKTFTGGAPFLSGGTSVPSGAVGAFGLVAVVGVAALARRRKQDAAEPSLVPSH
jgi:MYXO-CTERM domain-containing protein